MQAVNYDDYKTKKAAVDKKFSVYRKLHDDLVYTLPNYNKESAAEAKPDANGMVITTNQPAKWVQDNTIRFQVGVHGIFKSTWGNIQAGVTLALYMNGETGVTASKSFLDIQGGPEQTFRKTIDKVNIQLSLFKSPPITIGVIYIKVEVKGLFKFPVTVYATGNITTTIYAGFTGLYAAGFEVNVNYGIKTKKIKILWATITIPVGFDLDIVPKGVLVDDLAWYIGPAGDVYTGVKLQSARMGFICEPSFSFGPTVSICDTVYGGVSVGPTVELGYEMGTITNSKTSAITGIYGDIIVGGGIDARYNYGINISIPLILETGYHGSGILKRLVGVGKETRRVFTKYF